MKLKRNLLKPICLAIPGLLSINSGAAWDPQGSFNGDGFSASANATGFTQAKYDKAGVPITANKVVERVERCCGFFSTTTPVTNALIVNSSTWSENTYSFGRVAVNGTSGNASAQVTSI